jgi:serralysin
VIRCKPITPDYAARTGTLSFAPDTALTRTIIVPLNGDTAFEENETFFVLLSGATNASIGKARGTITNDDTSG